jgi:hypothetical protein
LRLVFDRDSQSSCAGDAINRAEVSAALDAEEGAITLRLRHFAMLAQTLSDD